MFVYHRFGDSKHKSTSTSIKELRSEFEYFKSNGYKVVKLDDIITKLKSNQDIPDNWVVLTIDDSYKSFYQNGLPIFKEYNYPFTLFVYIKATDKRYGDFMSWDQLRETKKYGDIQLHSYSHPHLVSSSDTKIKRDTQKAFDIFVKEMGYKPKYYAYPYGEFDDRVKEIIKSFGFEAVLNQNSGAINKNSNRFDIDRIALTGDNNIKQKLKTNSLNAKFISPKAYPKDSILKTIQATVDDSYKSVEVYITDYGWQRVKVNGGKIELTLNKKLKKNRVRLIIKAKNSTISTKILVKGD
jgi:peptidoglycan/xylan/chitin deacetylase (PgdA/CDA1 family)